MESLSQIKKNNQIEEDLLNLKIIEEKKIKQCNIEDNKINDNNKINENNEIENDK